MAEANGDIAGPIAESLDEFTDTTITPGMTFDAHADAMLHGTNGFRVIGDGSGSNAYGYKTFSEKTSLYARCYFQVDEMTINQYSLGFVLALWDGATALIQFGFRRAAAGAGNPDKWRCVGQDLTSTNGDIGAFDTPHYVDMYWTAGTGDNGGAVVWVDGNETPIMNELNNNLTAYAADTVRGGMYNLTMPNGNYIYVDDIIVNTTGPIGAYSDSITDWTTHEHTTLTFS